MLSNPIEKADCGEINMVQIPEKEFLSLATLFLSKLKLFKIPLIINDRVDICALIGAQGINLEQNGMHHFPNFKSSNYV